MRLTFLVWFSLVHHVWGAANLKQGYCNVTGSVFIRPQCKVRPANRTHEIVTVGFETTQPLNEFMFSLEVSTKMSSYWNRIIRIPPVDFCNFFEMTSKIDAMPIVQEAYREYSASLPSFPQKCPILPGKYYEINKVLKIYGFIQLPNNPVMDKFDFPNGRFKIEIAATNKDSSSMIQGSFIVDVRNRLGDDKI